MCVAAAHGSGDKPAFAEYLTHMQVREIELTVTDENCGDVSLLDLTLMPSVKPAALMSRSAKSYSEDLGDKPGWKDSLLGKATKAARMAGQDAPDTTLRLRRCEVISAAEFERRCLANPMCAPPFWRCFVEHGAAASMKSVLWCAEPEEVAMPRDAIAKCRNTACYSAIHRPRS